VAEFITSASPADDAAKLVAGWLEQAHARQGFSRLGIAGGSALKAVERLKALLPATTWSALRLTWVDERVVPMASPDSNRGAVERSGVLSTPPGLVLPMVLDGEDGPAACARYGPQFMENFDGRLDVALLGMGEDGHVASLFPGHALLGVSGVVAHLEDAPKPPPARVTLTMPLLRSRTTKRVVLATGAGKRSALLGLRANDASLPVSHLGAVTVVTDQLLKRTGDTT
jgi:6-phosphogluconolactonase